MMTTATTGLFLRFMIQRLPPQAGLQQWHQTTGHRINQLTGGATTTIGLIHGKLSGQQLTQHLLADIPDHNSVGLLFGQQLDQLLFAGATGVARRIVDTVALNTVLIQKDQAIRLGKMAGDAIVSHWNGSDHGW